MLNISLSPGLHPITVTAVFHEAYRALQRLTHPPYCDNAVSAPALGLKQIGLENAHEEWWNILVQVLAKKISEIT